MNLRVKKKENEEKEWNVIIWIKEE